MNALRAALFLALALAIPACQEPRQRLQARIAGIGVERLRTDAALLYKDTFASHGPGFVVIRPKFWPESFRLLSPRRVGAYEDGVSIALSGESDFESGVYIIPLMMNHAPSSSSSAHFEKLAEGIYAYSFGK